MLKYTNYNNLSLDAKSKLQRIIDRLYTSIGINKFNIKSDGTVQLIERSYLFGLIKIGVKKPIFELLNDDIPRAISMELWGSLDLSSHIRNELIKELNNNDYHSEINKVSSMINCLYKILEGRDEYEQIVNEMINYKLSNKVICLPESEAIFINSTSDTNVVTKKQDALFLIFRDLMYNRRIQLRGIGYASILFLALNAMRIIGMIPSFEKESNNKARIETIMIRDGVFDSS